MEEIRISVAVAVYNGEKYIRELQQELLKDDCYIPGYRNEDEKDLARQANVSATSSRPGCEARKVINGVTRNEEETLNLWQSAGLERREKL